MEHLAQKISEEDDRFACKVFPVGSAHEGTKIGCCDEFDYDFVLTKLSGKCKTICSPESPPGFVLVKAATPEYDEDLFNENGTLNTRMAKLKFEVLVKQVLSSSEFCEATAFEVKDKYFDVHDILPKPFINVNMIFTHPVDGYHVMHRVAVDIVPALRINDWWPENARRQELCQKGECLIVFIQPQDKYPWVGWIEPHGFIAFARAESRLLRECPQVVKAAYMIVKLMSKHCYFRPLFSSHVIKTTLLWCLDDAGFSNCSSDNSDEVNGDELLRLVQNILRRLLCFAAQDYVPSFFMPKCHQKVWLEEQYLKQFHANLYKRRLTYKDLFSMNEQQLHDRQLKKIKDMFINSHAMYWSVLSDTDELELFVSSTINPLYESSYDLNLCVSV